MNTSVVQISHHLRDAWPEEKKKPANLLIVNFAADKNSKMSISTESERIGMQQASDAVAITLKKMREYAKPGVSTKELDEYGGELLAQLGAHSAPLLTYDF